MNKTKNVIFLKDVESNIIEEAIVLIKENVNIKNIYTNKTNSLNKLDVLEEAENIVNKKIKDNEIEFQKYCLKKLKKKITLYKLLSISLFFSTIIFVIW